MVSFSGAKIIKICVNTKFFCNSWDICVIFSTFAGEMKVIRRIILSAMLCVVMTAYGNDFSIDDVLEDIYNQLCEEEQTPMEDWNEQLLEIAANPINLNHTNADELSRLMFLSDEHFKMYTNYNLLIV